MPKIQRNKTKSSSSYFITIPPPIIRAKGWQKGDNLNFILSTNGDLVMRKNKRLGWL